MKFFSFAFLAITTVTAIASPSKVGTPIDPSINKLVQEHLKQYSQQEFFSAIQVSIKVNDKISTYVVGNRSNSANSDPIDAQSLFNVGSITKSFTAAIALLAESESKLKLADKLSNYLSDYPHWGELTLSSLLNMSTGMPNYSDSPTMNYVISKNLHQYWSQDALINLVYSKEYNPPRKPGYFYSNTGYVLLDKILSKAYTTSFQKLIVTKIIKPLQLENTFYPIPNYPHAVLARMARGYSYNVYDNPELLGQDVTENNLSWAGAAGAVVANSEDVVHWIDDLFVGDKLLNAAQKAKMQQLVSTTTGLPLTTTSPTDPFGFGLGISQGYEENIGHFWFYEGETLGYRALYIYVPCNQVIISALFNSATNHDNDHARDLILKLYSYLLEQDKQLICEKNNVSAG